MRTRKPRTQSINTFAHTLTAETERWAETSTRLVNGEITTIYVYALNLDVETGEYTYSFDAQYLNHGTESHDSRPMETAQAEKMIGVWTTQFMS